jgi:hypothetical protein
MFAKVVSMASDSLPFNASGNEFDAFCDFIVHIKGQGNTTLTPEDSVQEFRDHQAQLQAWQEKNLLSQHQSRQGEGNP